MENFIFHNPTKLIFGKGMIANLATEIPAKKKIMITFGGGSVKKNGVYQQVINALKDKNYIEFWGIEPNPTIETLRKAVALGKEHHIDFLLAVGGGSVLDGTKLIASAIPYEGDAWELVQDNSKVKDILPMGTVLTLPATGSEMNKGAVISNKTTSEKFAFYSQFPVFSILDPIVTFSLPPYQISCGIADTFIHVMEQYLTTSHQSAIMDRWAEGILSTLIEIAPKIAKDPKNYDLMSNFMLCATMGLNGFIALGVTQDWATHMIGHELTALHGMTHGQSLAIVFNGTLKVLKEQKKDKILQYGERIWDIKNGSDEVRLQATIEATEKFFRSLNLATHLSECQITSTTINEIERRFNERHVAFGEAGNVNGKMAKEILEACL